MLLGVAVLVFLGAGAIALSGAPELELDAGWLTVASLTYLPTTVLSATELWIASKWLGVRLPVVDSLRVTILASAANLAPLPGAAVVRWQDLHQRGAPGADAVRALAAIGTGWVAVSTIAAGAALAVAGQREFSLLCLAAGAVLVLVTAHLRLPGLSRAEFAVQCLSLEGAFVALQTFQLFAVLRALGLEGSWAQVLSLPLSGAAATAVGLLPGGLGLRELFAGGLAELVDLTAASGVLVTSVDRIIGLGVLLVLAGTLIVVAKDIGGPSHRDHETIERETPRRDDTDTVS